MKRVGPLLSKLKNDEEDYNEQYELKEFYDLLLNKVNECTGLSLINVTTKNISSEKMVFTLLEYRELTPLVKREI